MEHLQHIWPTVAELAVDLDLPYQTVNSWKARGIPPKRFGEIISAAQMRGHTLGWEELQARTAGAA